MLAWLMHGLELMLAASTFQIGKVFLVTYDSFIIIIVIIVIVVMTVAFIGFVSVHSWNIRGCKRIMRNTRLTMIAMHL
jgi:hypothetical protein